jgi:hypothetical protein
MQQAEKLLADRGMGYLHIRSARNNCCQIGVDRTRTGGSGLLTHRAFAITGAKPR